MSEIKKQKNPGLFRDTAMKALRFDREAFENLYSKYLTPLYRYFMIRTSDRTLSEDLSQVVFIKVWENADKLSEPEKILPWLFAIARNTLIDYWRKKKEIPVDNIELLEEKGGVHMVEDEQDFKIKMDKVKKSLGLITEEQKEILILKFFDGLTNEEICVTLGKSAVAVRALQHRALQALKNILENEKE